ncbi:MAG: type II 3-dehydroquinate dehydratase [Bacteroidia bacterium]|nr:type II 3-dehydroquinate dehydratase [Bacteroidia bacterium]
MKLLILSGPNLNMLGKREPGIYGHLTLDELLAGLRQEFTAHLLDHVQSNIEGDLVTAIQQADGKYDGIIINAGAYTHTSVAIADAIASVKIPAVEVHLSNIFSREDYRHVSYLGARCAGSISGFGIESYRLAIRYFSERKA